MFEDFPRPKPENCIERECCHFAEAPRQCDFFPCPHLPEDTVGAIR